MIKERRNGQGAEVAGVTVEGKVAYLSLVQLQAGVTWQKSHYTRPENGAKIVLFRQKSEYSVPPIGMVILRPHILR